MLQNVRSDFMQKESNLFFNNLYKDYVFKKSVQDLYKDLKDDNVDDKIFKRWYDKRTGEVLTDEEQKELNNLIDNF